MTEGVPDTRVSRGQGKGPARSTLQPSVQASIPAVGAPTQFTVITREEWMESYDLAYAINSISAYESQTNLCAAATLCDCLNICISYTQHSTLSYILTFLE